MKKSGGGFGFASRTDGGIFLPFDDARQIFSSTFRKNEIGAMVLRVQEGSDTSAVAEKINAELDITHKVKPDKRDFSVVDPKSIQASINSILSLVTLFVGAIASISLLVGGLAIASSMFTSVMERTHEIGVLKAVGATEQNILGIFLFESGALGGIGGIIGSVLGSAVVLIAGAFGAPSSFSLPIAIFGVAFSFAIGMLSGYSPAKKAASMAPVEALRYE
jgi:putative ABC transport system permease protein